MRKRNFGVLVFSLLMCFMIFSLGAKAVTKKGTVYTGAIKKGKKVYCIFPIGIYEINLETGNKKRLVKGDGDGPEDMCLKGKWIYYINFYPTTSKICRVNISTGKKQTIAKADNVKIGGKTYSENLYQKYVISGKKIYCYNDNMDGAFKFVMGLDGKNKKKTTVKISMKKKNSNTSGYKTYYDEVGQNVSYYLKTPDKSYYIGKWEE